MLFMPFLFRAAACAESWKSSSLRKIKKAATVRLLSIYVVSVHGHTPGLPVLAGYLRPEFQLVRADKQGRILSCQFHVAFLINCPGDELNAFFCTTMDERLRNMLMFNRHVAAMDLFGKWKKCRRSPDIDQAKADCIVKLSYSFEGIVVERCDEDLLLHSFFLDHIQYKLFHPRV